MSAYVYFSTMPAKLIRAILDDTADLRALTAQTRRLLRLQSLLRRSLPAGINDQFSVGAFISGRLTVTTHSGAAAAKFRQLSPRLLKTLRHEEPELNAFKVTVQVSADHNPLRKKQIFLDPAAREPLLTLAEKLDNAPLRSAVLSLAQRAGASYHKQETLKEINSDKNQCNNKCDL